MLQASGTDGAAFRRRTSRQGETRGGLNLLYRPQACIFRLPASAPLTTDPPAPASPPDAMRPPPPAASSSKPSAVPVAAAPCPAPENFVPHRAGGCATPTGFAARAGVQTDHALTFKPDHSLGADQEHARINSRLLSNSLNLASVNRYQVGSPA